MFSKRTKASALLLAVCGAFLFIVGYKTLRRDQAILADWRGQEEAMQAMELPPKPPALVRMAILVTGCLLLATSGSVVIDIRDLRRRRHR